MDSLFATEITRPTIQMFFQRSLNTFFYESMKSSQKEAQEQQQEERK